MSKKGGTSKTPPAIKALIYPGLVIASTYKNISFKQQKKSFLLFRESLAGTEKKAQFRGQFWEIALRIP